MLNILTLIRPDATVKFGEKHLPLKELITQSPALKNTSLSRIQALANRFMESKPAEISAIEFHNFLCKIPSCDEMKTWNSVNEFLD